MTIQHEPLFGIAYADAATTLDQLPTVTRQVADSLAGAMGRAGYTPPDSTSFAQLGARVTTVEGRATAVEGRATALEGKFTDTGWVSHPWNTTKFTLSAGGVSRWRARNGRARLQAYLQGTWAANDAIFAAALPAEARPPAPSNVTSPSPLYRMGVAFGNAIVVFTIDYTGVLRIATAGTTSGFILDAEWDLT